jgi:hypothetical protein
MEVFVKDSSLHAELLDVLVVRYSLNQLFEILTIIKLNFDETKTFNNFSGLAELN